MPAAQKSGLYSGRTGWQGCNQSEGADRQHPEGGEIGRGLTCSSDLHALCGLRMLCALLLCSEAMPVLQVHVGVARRAISAFIPSAPGHCIGAEVLMWAAWVWCTLCKAVTWTVSANTLAACLGQLHTGALHRLLRAVKAVCPAAASPGHPVHKSHLSSEGLAGGAPGLRGLCSWLGACCQQQVMQTFLTVILSCCSWMSRRMSLQRQHLAGQRIPSGSLHRACGHSSRQSAVLARQ